MKELRWPPRRKRRYALQSGQGIAWWASRGASACASTGATIAGKLAIPELQPAPRQWLAKLNLMSWRSCENRNRKALPSNFYKNHFGTNESVVKQVPFGVIALCKQSALQEPEFLNIMLCSPAACLAGRILVDVFVQQFELAERSGCWSLPSGLPARQPSVAEKSHLVGKATTFFSTLAVEEAEISNLKLRRKELHL